MALFDDVPRVALRDLSPQEKLRQTLELCNTGFELKRQQLRRTHPDATEQEIREMMAQWARSKPIDYPPAFFKVRYDWPYD